MKMHVLPGDSLTETFDETGIEGEKIICRECLIEGDVKSENLADFWQIRAKFISENYGETESDYYLKTAAELQKLQNLPENSKICLWFENELFCQANLWFCLFLLKNEKAEIYRIAPVWENQNDFWKGFGQMSADDLRNCFELKKQFSVKEITLGAELWRAYANDDFRSIEKISATDSPCFPHLREVCRAEIEKSTAPKTILRQIKEKGAADFADIFTDFTKQAGVYGYGDSQVKKILQNI